LSLARRRFTLIELLVRAKHLRGALGVFSAIRKRFTLIELLVVVAIIAVLAALLLPALARARFMAQRSACLARPKQLYMAVMFYGEDNDDFWPTPNQWGADMGKLPVLSGRRMSLGLTWDYVQDARIYQCPTLYNLKGGNTNEMTWANSLETAIKTQSGSAGSSYYLEKVWDGNSVNHTVEEPRLRPHFGYRYVGAKLSNNVDNVSKDNVRFTVLPMLQCHQCPYWHFNMTHKGQGANIMFTDGVAKWYSYNYLGHNKHTINRSFFDLIKVHGQ
jgi:prepilin-type N-terminal cleavage/methylation domain-containing protein